MAALKVGLSQQGKPAPAWYRVTGDLMVGLVPIITGVLMGWGIEPAKLAKIMLIVSSIPAAWTIAKRYVGNGQEYATTGTTDALLSTTNKDTAIEAIKSVNDQKIVDEATK